MEAPSKSRNVVDWMKDFDDQWIVDYLEPRAASFIVVTENVNGCFHKGNILRTASGFGLKEFWVVGRKQFDKRSTVGSHKRFPTHHAPDFTTMFEQIDDVDRYTIVTLDNVPGSVSMVGYDWPEKVIMIVGEEQRGVSSEALDLAHDVVYVPMRGAVRSFSVSTAAGMAMYDYSAKRGLI